MKLVFGLLPWILLCLWDRDTLRIEAEGSPELLEILVGRFERPPPEHFEMRLARVTEELSAGAELNLFDDAAVACDRLGRSDEAIEWMVRKRETLDRLQSSDPEHEYRYLANLGTFHAHRWLSGDRLDPGDLERARNLIRAAIKLNPEAHFGRERYQLIAIETLLDSTTKTETKPERESIVSRIFEGQVNDPARDGLKAAGYDDAVEGLSGLIFLGEAWESPLVWHSLQQALMERGDAFLARLAELRIVELASGSSPSAEFGAHVDLWSARGIIEPTDLKRLDRWWERARASAETWQQRRTAYASERYLAGLHPDTHDGFWDDWDGLPALPRAPGKLIRVIQFAAAVASRLVLPLIAVVLAVTLVTRWLLRRRRRSPS